MLSAGQWVEGDELPVRHVGVKWARLIDLEERERETGCKLFSPVSFKQTTITGSPAGHWGEAWVVFMRQNVVQRKTKTSVQII
jgi:hypothetical protein